jgi:hypothetical protein
MNTESQDSSFSGVIRLCFGRSRVEFVTVRLGLNFIIGFWGYTVDIEDRVSGGGSRSEHGKNDARADRE